MKTVQNKCLWIMVLPVAAWFASDLASPQFSCAEDEADPLLARGQELFASQCAICHGEDGDGKGKFAYLMNPRPRSFRSDPLKMSTTENLVPSDADLTRTISRGMPGSAMPPWGHLPVEDVSALVSYIRHLICEGIKEDFDPGPAPLGFRNSCKRQTPDRHAL